MKKVYISHAYGGKEENKQDIEKIIKHLVDKFDNEFEAAEFMFISPVHMFGFLYNDVSYERGINWCLNVLKECNSLLITGDNWQESRGVKIEMEYAIKNNIPVFILKNNFNIIRYDN